MEEDEIRQSIVQHCASLFARGLSVGTAGNISARVTDGILMTPTNVSLGAIRAEDIAKLDLDGNHVAGLKPSKEFLLHRAFYDTRPGTGAVVHLHSTFATALSCVEGIDPDDCIAPLTPYVVMRVGKVRLLQYVRPGDPQAGELIRQLHGKSAAVLLANHGPVVSGQDLHSAVCAAEELEETAKLLVILNGQRFRTLTTAQVDELKSVFGGDGAPK